MSNCRENFLFNLHFMHERIFLYVRMMKKVIRSFIISIKSYFHSNRSLFYFILVDFLMMMKLRKLYRKIHYLSYSKSAFLSGNVLRMLDVVLKFIDLMQICSVQLTTRCFLWINFYFIKHFHSNESNCLNLKFFFKYFNECLVKRKYMSLEKF